MTDVMMLDDQPAENEQLNQSVISLPHDDDVNDQTSSVDNSAVIVIASSGESRYTLVGM